MSKAITANQGAAKTEMERTEYLSAYRKVTVVVEHFPEMEEPQPLADLAVLLDSSQVSLSLIYALPDFLAGVLERPDEASVEQERERRQADVISLWRQSLEHAGFHIQNEQTCIMQERNAQQILDQLQDTEQELLVIFTGQHRSGITIRSHFTMTLAMHAPISVLVVKRNLTCKNGHLNVLLGVDASDASLTAARKLAAFIRVDNIDLTLATVQSPFYQENAVLAPYVNQAILDEASEANAEMIFDMTSDILENFNVKAQKVIKQLGSPATELGYLAEAEHPDLIVVGSHNRKGFLAWLAGSVSSQLLHWDTHNILIVR